jgi:hypothetical protein
MARCRKCGDQDEKANAGRHGSMAREITNGGEKSGEAAFTALSPVIERII